METLTRLFNLPEKGNVADLTLFELLRELGTIKLQHIELRNALPKLRHVLLNDCRDLTGEKPLHSPYLRRIPFPSTSELDLSVSTPALAINRNKEVSKLNYWLCLLYELREMEHQDREKGRENKMTKSPWSYNEATLSKVNDTAYKKGRWAASRCRRYNQ